MAAEDLDLGPPCEDRRWQSNYSVCQGGWRTANSASCRRKNKKEKMGGGERPATLNLEKGFKHPESVSWKRNTSACRYALARASASSYTSECVFSSFNSRELWYCQVCAVYLSLKRSQSARISPKKQLGKIHSKQVHSSAPRPQTPVFPFCLSCTT